MTAARWRPTWRSWASAAARPPAASAWRGWAAGDVTGVALFTHVATYRGLVAADNILGRERSASYEGIPRVVFADPEIAAVGLTPAQAAARGIAAATAEIGVAGSAARSWTYE